MMTTSFAGPRRVFAPTAGLPLGQPTPNGGGQQIVPQPDSTKWVVWVFLAGMTGFGTGLAIGTIWGAKALRGG